MEVDVWDTYVKKKDGRIMHFDILVPSQLKDEETIYTFGKEYLQSKGQADQPLSASQCRFCHVEEASSEMVESINRMGYYIVEISNCT